MNREVVIERRFRGPPNSGNGGYSCGVVAEGIDGVATATLRVPPPLDTPMDLVGGAAGARLMHGETLIGEAIPDRLDLEVPAAPSLSVAAEAARRYPGLSNHPFPGCFVCGPERRYGDGLRIFPGPIDGSEVFAAPWTPDDSLEEEEGPIGRRHVWAALDCPSYFGLGIMPPALLGRLTADIDRLPKTGEPLVVIGWARGSEGRKHFGGSAIVDPDGGILARAAATWIEIDRLPV